MQNQTLEFLGFLRAVKFGLFNHIVCWHDFWLVLQHGPLQILREYLKLKRSKKFQIVNVFQSIDGMMTLLEITNRIEARPLISRIEESYRTLPPNVMLYVSLKGVIGLIFNIVVLFFVTLTGWEVVDGNKRKSTMEFIIERDKSDLKPSPVTTLWN